MIVKLLTEHHLEFLSLKEGCRGSPESTLVKMSNCWKSHASAQLQLSVCLVSQILDSTGTSIDPCGIPEIVACQSVNSPQMSPDM